MKIRLLVGCHRIGPTKDADGVVVREARNVYPDRGEDSIFESPVDLSKTDKERFELVSDSPEIDPEEEAMSDSEADLTKLTVAQLKESAAELGLEFPDNIKKAELIKLIEEATAA